MGKSDAMCLQEGGMTVVKDERDEFITTRPVTDCEFILIIVL